LSIRCSSIHFLPSRSLPVSVAGTCACAGRGRSSATAIDATAIVMSGMSETQIAVLMRGLGSACKCCSETAGVNRIGFHLATRNLKHAVSVEANRPSQNAVSRKGQRMPTRAFEPRRASRCVSLDRLCPGGNWFAREGTIDVQLRRRCACRSILSTCATRALAIGSTLA
jgi:hypothetical protein